jgi:hypothetical protein
VDIEALYLEAGNADLNRARMVFYAHADCEMDADAFARFFASYWR